MSKKKPFPCGIDGCQYEGKPNETLGDWLQHVKEKHPKFYRREVMPP